MDSKYITMLNETEALRMHIEEAVEAITKRYEASKSCCTVCTKWLYYFY
jgi:hypothetical protein